MSITQAGTPKQICENAFKGTYDHGKQSCTMPFEPSGTDAVAMCGQLCAENVGYKDGAKSCYTYTKHDQTYNMNDTCWKKIDTYMDECRQPCFVDVKKVNDTMYDFMKSYVTSVQPQASQTPQAPPAP
tara:strand:+ start:264 stop:647 length:384 start_codon:yes stop_codon:yes gene_type:complete